MNRFVMTALVVGILSGCAGSAPTPNSTATMTAPTSPAPTASRAPTPSPAPTASPVPAASPEPTASPSAQGARELPGGALEPGTYFGEFEGTRFTFTIPELGWSGYAEAGCCVITEGGDSDGAIIFFTGDITELYARACEISGHGIRVRPDSR